MALLAHLSLYALALAQAPELVGVGKPETLALVPGLVQSETPAQNPAASTDPGPGMSGLTKAPDARSVGERLLRGSELPLAAQDVRAAGIPEEQLALALQGGQKLGVSAVDMTRLLRVMAQDASTGGLLPNAGALLLEPFQKIASDPGFKGSLSERYAGVTEEQLRAVLTQARQPEPEPAGKARKPSR